MDKGKGKFVVTFNNATADKLFAMGLRLVDMAYNRYVFMNDEKALFDKVEDIFFTNVLYF